MNIKYWSASDFKVDHMAKLFQLYCQKQTTILNMFEEFFKQTKKLGAWKLVFTIHKPKI